jgi:putative drug exporter of the RND superfamily
LFAALGRFTVRYRWLIVAGWIVVTVVLSVSLPSLSSVEKSSNSQFLPASSASVRAEALDAPFGSKVTPDATLVAAASGPLTAADNAAIDRVEAAMGSIPHVVGVVDQGVSANGRARTALVQLRVPSVDGSAATAATAGLRSTFATTGAPTGLALHLTGPVAQAVDQKNQNGHTQALTELLSVLFIIALLFLTFRALLAPLIALLPSMVALFAAEPIIALSTHLGVQVSDLTPILLVVILLGAGTDYGLFLIFRMREELRRGKEVHEAVAFSLCKVGESITFSGLTVIGALVTVVIATFGLYKGLGPALAIGILVALVANLTLLPALLAILGKSTFWPRIPKAEPPRHGAWGRIAGKVVGRPVWTLVAGLVIFGGLALSMLAYSPSGFADPAAAASSDSARGQALLMADYPSAESDATSLVFRLPDSVWNHPQLLAVAGHDLARSSPFSSVVGALDPNGTVIAAADLAQAHQQLGALGSTTQLPDIEPPGTTVSATTYEALKDSSRFISSDGRTIRFDATLRAGPSTSTAAAAAVPAARAAVTQVAHEIGATASGVDGNAAVASDVGSISGGDLMKIIPIVMIVLALLLAIVLRSLIAPLYLVVSVALSYLASLGLAVLVFELIGGQDGINFVLPFFMFIFIMALGQDYNILVMTRIREEAHHAPIREAVRRAVEATGTTVTSAGLILAGTFGVLTASGTTQVQEIGLGLAAGILLDTFFVRTLLVPSVVVLLGRWNWWPSSLSSEDHSGGGQGDGGITTGSLVPEDLGPFGGCEATEPSARPLAGVGH